MALFKGSRYETTTPFQPDASGKVVFKGLRPRPMGNPEAVLEYVIAQKDRLDALGHHFYSRPADWYRIAEANPAFLFAEDILHEAPPPPPEPAASAEDEAAAKEAREEYERENGGERVGATVLIPRREVRG